MSTPRCLKPCVNWIRDTRKGIVCAADDTVEPSFVAETSDGTKIRVIDGDGVVHKCRDFNVVYEAMIYSQTQPFVTDRELKAGDSVRGILNLAD